MPYTNAWTTVAPDNLTLANQIDDEFRKLRVDIQERADTIIGAAKWSTVVDVGTPIIDGSTIKSLAQLTSGLIGKPNINASNNFLPKRLDADNLTDSALSDDGTVVVVATGRRFQVNGVSYQFPASGADNTFLKHATGGVLSWVTVASLGAAVGAGTNTKLAKWTSGAGNIGDSIVTDNGAGISVAGTIAGTAITASGTLSAASATVTGQTKSNTIVVGNASGIKMQTLAGSGTKMLQLVEDVAEGASTVIRLDGADGGMFIGTQRIIGPRKTGWGPPTGTKNKNTFSTDSVNLSSLAGRVGALIDDLMDHGLIG